MLFYFRLIDLGSVSLPDNTNVSKKKTSSTPTDSSFFEPKGLPIHPPPQPSPETSPDIVVSTGEEKPTEPSTPLEPDWPSGDQQMQQPLPTLQPGDALLMPGFISEHTKCNTPEPERRSTFDRLKSRGRDLINLIYNPSEESDDQCPAPAELKQKNEDDDDVDQLDGSLKLWVGKDYTNFIVKDFADLDSPYVDLVDRTTTPRMPWHDVGLAITGAAARDVARHFIQRWNATKLEKARCNIDMPYLLPKSYDASYGSLPMPDGPSVTCQVIIAWRGCQNSAIKTLN